MSAAKVKFVRGKKRRVFASSTYDLLQGVLNVRCFAEAVDHLLLLYDALRSVTSSPSHLLRAAVHCPMT